MKAYTSVALFLLIFFAGMGGASAQMTSPARYVYVEDFETGIPLMEKSADVPMPPASMSKLMTLYMVFDALKKGYITPEQKFTVSKNAFTKGGAATGGSTMFLEIGKSVSVEDLIKGIIIQSGNDACIVVAEGLSGSEKAFADDMNMKAKEIGLEKSHFVNSTGLPARGQEMSPKDLVRLAKRLYEDFPEYYPIFAEREFRYNKITQPNRNPLLYWPTSVVDKELYFVDGLKTGHTQASGYGLLASGMNLKNGRRVFLVFSGREIKTESARREEAIRLMRWSLGNFDKKTVARTGEPLAKTKVWLGEPAEAVVTTAQDFSVLVPTVTREKIKAEVTYNENMAAPLKKGKVIGTVTVRIKDLPDQSVDLILGEDVKEMGVFRKLWHKTKYYLLG